MGPYIKIQIIDPLWKAKQGYGDEFQPLSPCGSRDICKKKLSTIDFKKSILIRFSMLPNRLILYHLFQSWTFEIDLFHSDLFHIDKIFQTRPKSFTYVTDLM